MEPTPSLLAVSAVVFLATFTRSALGFGDALIAMPLLVMLLDVKVAAPLVALGGATIAAVILAGAWRQVDFRATWRLVLSTMVGIPLGLFFLKAAPQKAVEGVLGLLLVGFGSYNLVTPRLPVIRDERLSYAFGVVAGILGGAYNTSGPPVVVYGTMRRWSAERFRATLQGYFLPVSLMVLTGHALAGLWTGAVLRLYGYTLPVILVAVLAGGRVNKRLSGAQFHRAVYGFLVLMGAVLMTRVF